MPIDFSKPSTTDNYSTAFVPNINNALKALGSLLDPTYAGTVTATPTGTKRINNGNFEQFNGTSWASYNVNIGGNAATATTAASCSGNAATATYATSAGSATTATNLSGGSVNGTTGTFSGLVKGNGGGVGLGKITTMSGTGTPSGTVAGDLVLRF